MNKSEHTTMYMKSELPLVATLHILDERKNKSDSLAYAAVLTFNVG